MRKIIKVLLICLIYYAPAITQTVNIHKQLRFSSITIDDGLSHNKVNVIIQDPKGFMWFGTNEGLNKFDGYNISVFRHVPDDTTSLLENLVKCMVVDPDNNIWLGFIRKGFSIYDPGKESFRNFRYYNDKSTFSLTYALYNDVKGYVWTGSSDTLFCIDPNMHQIMGYWKHHESPKENTILCIYEDSFGNMWVGTSHDGLYLFDRENERFIPFRNEPGDPTSISGNYIETVYQDKSGNLWIGTHNNGLNFYNHSDSSFTHLIVDKNQERSKRVRAIKEDKFGNFWIGTRAGLYLKDKTSNVFYRYAHQDHEFSRLTDNSIMTLYIDANDVMWVGTHSGGINYVDLNQKKITHFYADKQNPLFLSGSVVQAFMEDEKGNLWIGTEAGGLNYFDKEKGTFSYYMHHPVGRNSLSINNVKALAMDDKNNLWIGTYQGGLDYFNSKSEVFTHHTHDPANPYSLMHNNIYCLLLDSKNNLWIGTDIGLDLKYSKSDRFKHFDKRLGEEYGFITDRIHVIFEDSKNNIWFGSFNNGLFKMENNINIINAYHSDIFNGTIETIYEDTKGNLWIGAWNGLFCIQKDNDTIIQHTGNEGILLPTVCGILEDESENLWISTFSSGLIKFVDAVINPREPNFRKYDNQDGIQSRQFNYNAYYKTKSGEMLFGGINGFNSFFPEEIRDNPYKPTVVITGLKIDNNEVPIGKVLMNRVILENSITTSDKIILTYKANNISFEFAALHYAQPFKNQYAYMLEGFDKRWNYTTASKRFANYTNLPGKDYVLKVKASNNDGVWNEIPTELKIRVIPPFWRKSWFIVSMIILTIGILYLLYKMRIYSINQQRIRLKESVAQRTAELSEANILLEEKQEEIMMQNEELANHRNNLEQLVEERTIELEKAKQKAEGSDKLKSAFLTNMSHEIRTPMNAIVGFSNLLLEDPDKEEIDEYVKIINNNCDSLMVLINDILDISLIEADQLKINPAPFNANAVLKELESIYKIKNKPNVNFFLVQPEKDPLIILTDQYRFRQVLDNLLSNAFKYTEEGKIKFGYDLKGENIVFYVSDSGIGINENDSDRIFNYFQKLENNATKLYRGAGIGLSISKKIVELLGGKIWLKSEPEKGSTFYFSIPIPFDEQNIIVRPVQRKEVSIHQFPDVHVIIAEDDPTNFALLERILKPLKVKITWFKDGREVVEFFRSNHDIKKSMIIMDIKLPVINGIDAFHAIRKINRNIPIVAVTAYASDNAKMDILQHGFTDYISKPVLPSYLVDKLVNVIQMSVLEESDEDS